MSLLEDNKAVMLRFIDTVNKGDFDALDEVVDAATYVENNPAWGALDLAASKETYATILAAMPDLHFEPDADIMVAEGDRVAARGTVSGTHTGTELFGVPPTGKKLVWTGLDISRISDGKIVERWLCADLLGLMQQLGLGGP